MALIFPGPSIAMIRPLCWQRDDPQQRQDLLFGILMNGEKDIEYRAELYRPYSPDLTQDVMDRSRPR